MKTFTEFLNSKKLNNNLKNKVVIFGAGNLGTLAIKALRQKDIAVDYFSDNDVTKWNTIHEGKKILPPSDLKNLDKNTNFFIGYYLMTAIEPDLVEMGFKNIYSISEFVTREFVLKNFERKHLLEKTLRQVSYYKEMSMKEEHIKNFTNNNKLHLKTIDIQVTEKCSLKCADCCNLMQYYESPKDSPDDILFRSIDKLMESIDTLDEFRAIGGDPFMNKELYKVINKLVSYEKCKKVIIYTNAKIIPKGENLNCLKHNKVIVDITNYGFYNTVHDKLVNLLEKENIKHSTLLCSEWTDCGKIQPFSGKSEPELEKLFSSCCQSDLYSLLHGKLYRCPFSANGVNLKAIPYNASDEVNLLDEKLSIDEIRSQIKKLCFDKKFLTACSYCTGKNGSATKIAAAQQTKQPLNYKKF